MIGDLSLLNERQAARIEPHLPQAHGVPPADDRRVIIGIVYVIKHGLQWKDAPKAYGPHKTLYNRFRSRAKSRAHHDPRHAPESTPQDGEFAQKGDGPRRIGRTKGGLNSKLHTVCDGEERSSRAECCAASQGADC